MTEQEPPPAQQADYDPSAYRYGGEAIQESDLTDAGLTGPEPFFKLLSKAISFPLVGNGRSMIIAGTLLFFVLRFLAQFSLTGFIIVLMISGYVCAYMMKIIGAVAGGADVPPPWPDISRGWSELFHPSLLMFSSVLFSLASEIVYLSVTGGWPAVTSNPTSLMLLVLAGLLLPMALLATTLFDSLSGLNPLVIVPAIVKVFPAYVVACVVLACAVALRLVVRYLCAWIFLVGDILDGFVSLYLLMAEMYVIGLIYRCYEHRLCWFEPR